MEAAAMVTVFAKLMDPVLQYAFVENRRTADRD